MTNQLWVLQNQDGNSALTTIDPSTDTKTKYTYTNPSAHHAASTMSPLSAAMLTSATRTPPITATRLFTARALGGGKVTLGNPVLSYGDAGTNDASGNSLVNDPDSLDLTPNGSLLLTGGDDGALTTVSHPGGCESIGQLRGLCSTAAGSRVSGLDDVVFGGAAAQDLLVADTKNNTIYRVSGPFQNGTAYALGRQPELPRHR